MLYDICEWSDAHSGIPDAFKAKNASDGTIIVDPLTLSLYICERELEILNQNIPSTVQAFGNETRSSRWRFENWQSSIDYRRAEISRILAMMREQQLERENMRLRLELNKLKRK